mmetsp:Transcript_8128/g.24084  ORF Transcript_8128/g.24084 Transcript_8128/m.24084 type:complete len:440 (-) Transcript_8128:60-1379(-)
MKRAAPGDEGNDAAKGLLPEGDDWMERMPEALRKQMQQMLDMYLGAGIIMTKEKFLAMASQGAEHMGRTCLLTLIRSPAEEFDAVEDGVLEKISKMSPQEATNMLPHAGRACCGPVLEALIRQGADLNSFNFQRGALTAGGAPFAIVAKKARPRLLQLMLEAGGADPNAIDSMGWSALHILALAASDRGGTTEDWQRTLKSDRETAEATRVRQHGDVIECVRVMLEAGADPTLQTSRQAMMTDRIYKERFFPHELLADANGAPATDDRSETIRGMLLDAIAERGGLPSQRAQDLAAARQRAAHREAVTDAAQQGGDPIQRAGCNAMMSHPSSRMQVQALKLDEAEARARMKKSGRARVCDFCNKRSETKLRACGKCKFVFYCDAACQRKAWPTHKKECGSALDRLCLALERNASRIDTQHAAIQMQANEADDARRAAQN